jgi:UDP-N-acetylmuramate--alanine ligase
MSLAGRKLHLIGIGGAGMSGLALVAHELGAVVSGSDRSASSYTERLTAAGVKVAIGHDAGNLPAGAEVVISTAIDEANPELARARELGLTVLHRSDLLAELVSAKPRCIAVAGTHGKTTTTAMIAHALTETGSDPSFFVGGEVNVGGRVTNAHWGAGDLVVVEADESDRSFLKLSPEVAIVTNVELDHHRTWGGGIDELLAAFAEYAAPAAHCVVWRMQPRLAELAPAERVVGFGVKGAGTTEPGDFLASDLVTPADPARGTSFTLTYDDGIELPVQLGVRGEHNVLNALAALAGLSAAGADVAQSAKALASFNGVARRFERLGTSPGGASVYDDYAHHPTEVRAALTTARATAGAGRVIAVFQPHLYSRTASLARDFGRALALADVAIVLDVYPARERAADFPGVTGWLVATATADARPGMRVLWQPTEADAAAALARELREGDLCITIGAGDVFRIGERLVGRS